MLDVELSSETMSLSAPAAQAATRHESLVAWYRASPGNGANPMTRAAGTVYLFPDAIAPIRPGWPA